MARDEQDQLEGGDHPALRHVLSVRVPRAERRDTAYESVARDGSCLARARDQGLPRARAPHAAPLPSRLHRLRCAAARVVPLRALAARRVAGRRLGYDTGRHLARDSRGTHGDDACRRARVARALREAGRRDGCPVPPRGAHALPRRLHVADGRARARRDLCHLPWRLEGGCDFGAEGGCDVGAALRRTASGSGVGGERGRTPRETFDRAADGAAAGEFATVALLQRARRAGSRSLGGHHPQQRRARAPRAVLDPYAAAAAPDEEHPGAEDAPTAPRPRALPLARGALPAAQCHQDAAARARVRAARVARDRGAAGA